MERSRRVVPLAAGSLSLPLVFVWFCWFDEGPSGRGDEPRPPAVSTGHTGAGLESDPSSEVAEALGAVVPSPGDGIARVEVPPPTPPAAAPASVVAGCPASFEDRFEEALASFTTDEPKVELLREALGHLGRTASVDEGSLVERDGVLRGTLAFEALPEVAASFELEPDLTKVTLDLAMPGEEADPTFRFRQVTLSFSDDLEETAAHVQYHPDTGLAPASLLAADETRIVGWSAFTELEAGTTLDPILMRATDDGQALRIGRLPDRPIVERPWDWDHRPYDPWADLLGPYRR